MWWGQTLSCTGITGGLWDTGERASPLAPGISIWGQASFMRRLMEWLFMQRPFMGRASFSAGRTTIITVTDGITEGIMRIIMADITVDATITTTADQDTIDQDTLPRAEAYARVTPGLKASADTTTEAVRVLKAGAVSAGAVILEGAGAPVAVAAAALGGVAVGAVRVFA